MKLISNQLLKKVQAFLFLKNTLPDSLEFVIQTSPITRDSDDPCRQPTTAVSVECALWTVQKPSVFPAFSKQKLPSAIISLI